MSSRFLPEKLMVTKLIKKYIHNTGAELGITLLFRIFSVPKDSAFSPQSNTS
jgi:hypothetical protein